MAEHHIVEHRDTSSSTGAMLGIAFVLLLVVVALFFAFGGPSRFASGPGTPNQTNVNVPAQSQPQSGPNINVPRQIDVNVNQQPPPAQQPPAQQPPAQQPPAQQEPANQQAPAPNR